LIDIGPQRVLDARVESFAYLVLVVAVQVSGPEKWRVVRFHRVDGGPRPPLLLAFRSLASRSAAEHDVGDELDLI
jgi:hypothetical protein